MFYGSLTKDVLVLLTLLISQVLYKTDMRNIRQSKYELKTNAQRTHGLHNLS